MNIKRWHTFSVAMISTFALWIAGCTCGRRSEFVIPTGDASTDARGGEGGIIRRDGGPSGLCSVGCADRENCGADGTGNGLDDDCNGALDDGCQSCIPGTARQCYGGYPSELGIGACAAGTFVCGEFPSCEGQVRASAETCNSIDDDCNGITDDGLSGCVTRAMCLSADNAQPLSTYSLNGSRVYSGNDVREWAWGIDCPPNIPAARCPQLSNPNVRDPSAYLSQSGIYTVNLRITFNDGTQFFCRWPLYVKGDGFRVELDWESEMGTDLDLHLIQYGTGNQSLGGDDDCYYGNCRPEDNGVSWSLANTPLANCQNAPGGGGAAWRALGTCRNPRLDIDTNGLDGRCSQRSDATATGFCAAENVNIDNPRFGVPYRVIGKWYDGQRAETARVNIYCGGQVRASFVSPQQLAGTPGRIGFPPTLPDGDNWYVADVVFFEGPCGVDCRVNPINTISRGNGIGGPWTCQPNAQAQTCE